MSKSEIYVVLFSYSRLLAPDFAILNHGQVMRTTPKLTSPLLASTSHQREGCRSVVVKVIDSWPACREFDLSTAEYPLHVEERCTLNLSKAQTSSR
ncbi:hypothetical protein TNCV_4839221 [Trichonephila clavipes]|nr:hypothetical protein TNCV_4839221 [Trichonephila clavipes]